MGVTEYQLAIENAIAEDWELVKDTAGRVNTAAEIFPLAYRFGWHAARKHVGYTSADERIRQLEKQCEVLAAKVHRMRPVVDAAIKWNETNYRDMKECELALDAIGNACDDYESSKPK